MYFWFPPEYRRAHFPVKKNTFGMPISNAAYVVFEQNGKNAKVKKLALLD